MERGGLKSPGQGSWFVHRDHEKAGRVEQDTMWGCRALLHTSSEPYVAWLRMCVHMACASILQSSLKGTIRQCTLSFPPRENGTDATSASQLPLWLASCVPPVSQRSLCLHLFSPLCSHSLPIYFRLPHFFSLSLFFRPCLKVVFPGSVRLPPPRCYSKIKIKTGGGGGGSGSQAVSC